MHPAANDDPRSATATTGRGRPTPGRTRSARALTVFLEVGDVARLLGRSAGGVRLLARRGELRLAARTARGSSLFLPADVEQTRMKLERQSPDKRRRQTHHVQSD